MHQRPLHFAKRLLSISALMCFVFFALATTQPIDPELREQACGEEVLDDSGALPLEPCGDRNDCNEVCCTCADGETLYITRGCDFDSEVCFEENALCEQALDDDPSLCDALE